MFVGEIITLLGSTLLAGLLKGWSKKMEMEKERNTMMMAALSQRADIYSDARKHGLKDREFAWTRRTIALISIIAIIVLPIAVPLISALLGKQINITHGYTEWQNGFLFFTEGKDVMKWKEVVGPVITPLHSHLVVAIIGYLFGTDIVGKRK